MGELGNLLREAREKKNLTYADVAKETKIREKTIIALEEEDYANLPERIYTKGLLKNYATFLALDTKEVMRLFGEELTQLPTPLSEPQAGLTPPLLSPDLIAGLVILIGLALAAFWGYHQYVAPLLAATPTPEPSPTPQATATLAPSPTPTISGLQVQIRITARTWLEVTVDGEQTFQGLMEAGKNQTWLADESLRLRAGNAGGVVVIINGQEQPAIGAEGEVVEMEWTKEQFLATPEAPPVGPFGGTVTPEPTATETTPTPSPRP